MTTNRWSAATRRALVLLAAGLAAGCGGSGPTYAPVAGKVTLNGKPLAGASVEFQPIPATKDADPGSGSMGTTDAQGRFVLKSQLDAADGAIVGKHRVRIYVYTPHKPGDDRDADSGGPGAIKKKALEPPVPVRYNSETELEIDVPAAGLADYHFDLKSP